MSGLPPNSRNMPNNVASAYLDDKCKGVSPFGSFFEGNGFDGCKVDFNVLPISFAL